MLQKQSILLPTTLQCAQHRRQANRLPIDIGQHQRKVLGIDPGGRTLLIGANRGIDTHQTRHLSERVRCGIGDSGRQLPTMQWLVQCFHDERQAIDAAGGTQCFENLVRLIGQ